MDHVFTPSADDLVFTPVPVAPRRDGWTPDRQRGFIQALGRVGSVATAARSVGRTARSAYRLRARPDAAEFAVAWDCAVDRGADNMRDHFVDRALNGAIVPRFYAGRQVGVVHRFYDRCGLAVLSGGGKGVAERLRNARETEQRAVFFRIERAWKRERRELDAERDRRIEAERRLDILVRCGVIGPEWADPAAQSLSLIAPADRPRPRVPRPAIGVSTL